MLTLRPSLARGHHDYGWLDTRHTFSFGRYHDPRHMGFRALRVINEDRVQPGRGFGEHPHDHMEILSVVLAGRLAHKDSMGNVRELTPGMAQIMSAGEGLEHSEFNPSKNEPVHFYQIWLEPGVRGTAPGYVDLKVPAATRDKPVRVIASPDGREGSGRIHADAVVGLATLGAGAKATLALAAGRHAWVQVSSGTLTVNGQTLGAGDGAAISDEREVRLATEDGAEAIVFDLA